ncbi:23S rRNA (pseudouridine(1915)-N(3))-methyltransferase RlmH [Candidatus Woesearchaeota archaeon]|nr:23S rRNA (pseudouridine(1915)-N(3))-methyltransferase RlmH [Candidatus Woesearchaeota archaeon]
MITILAIGKIKQPFVQQGMHEFLKRLQQYTKIEYSEKNNLKLDNINGYVIALDEHGQPMNSLEFAQFIKKTTLEHKNLIFIIGEAKGLSEEIRKKCSKTISLSTMTFPTQLVRLIFAEQLYRAFTIINNEPYHKQ